MNTSYVVHREGRSSALDALCLCFLFFVLYLPGIAAEGATKAFDIPRGEALATLKRFSTQADARLLYSVDAVKGVTTNAVKGSYTPREALNRLVSDTGLVVTENARDGALALSRKAPDGPNGPRVAQTTASDRPNENQNRMSRRGDASATPDEVLKLSPFIVATEEDTGYIASDSLVGGRINTNLLKTPADISVLTKDFLADVAADSYQEAAIWLTGATVTPGPFQDFGADVTWRGLGKVGGGYPVRNYFRYNNAVDGYIYERLESARGPNSLLFSDGVVGGVFNTLTKRARFGTASGNLQTRVDSEGSRRFTIDLNRPLTENAAVRVNLVASEGRNWVDTFYDNRLGVQIAASWRPWKGGEVRTELEWMRWKKNFAPRSVSDSASNWDQATVVSSPLTANPAAATGISRFTSDRLVYGPAYANIGVQNYRNFGASNGTSLTITQDDRGVARFPSVPRNFSVQPENVFHQSNYRVLGAYFTQEIGRAFSFEIAAQRAYSPHFKSMTNSRWDTYTIDVNTVLPNGAPNPNFGKAYSDVAMQTTPNQDNQHTDFRVAAVYVLPVKRFSQRFNLLASWREETFNFNQFKYVRTNGPNPNLRHGSNAIFIRRYFDDEKNTPVEFRSGNGIEIGTVQTTDRFERQRLDTVQLASVGSYWGDRVSLIGGVRRDTYDRFNTTIGKRLPTGHADPAGYTLSTADRQETTMSVGTVVFPVKAFGIYANYAESFNPAGSGNQYLDGTFVVPTRAIGKSAGFRFSLGGGRIVGSLGYYNTFERGRHSGFSSAQINRIWENIGQSERMLEIDSYRDTQTAGGSGYEADFVANLSKALRVRFNYARPDNEQHDTLPQTRKYFNANIATWQAGADDPNNTFRNQIQADIDALKTRIENANEGRKINDISAYTANVFINYTIQSGPLKSLRLGGGANMIGKTIVGNEVGRPFDYVYRDAYRIVSAVTGYSFRWAELRWDVQLNVSNVLDYDEPIYLGTRAFQGRTVMQGFYYREPRKFTLTTTVRF